MPEAIKNTMAPIARPLMVSSTQVRGSIINRATAIISSSRKICGLFSRNAAKRANTPCGGVA